jgi:phosphatidylserine/phosphatidylglycerophosphate/cardiolipin synthase-like enzyme
MKITFLAALILSACTAKVDVEDPGTSGTEADTSEPDVGGDPDTDTDTQEPLPEPDDACEGTLIAVVGTDPWARTASVNEAPTPSTGTFLSGDGVAWWSQDVPGPVTIGMSAQDHHNARVRIENTSTGVRVERLDDRSRWAVTRNVATVDGLSCDTLTVWVGLDHEWFAPSASAPSRNRAEVLFDGEEGWEAAYDMVVSAQERVTWSTWYWESDFELIRPLGHLTMSESQREANTVMAVLEEADVDTRVLINRFWGENFDFTAYINTDSALRSYAEDSDDGFEVMLQGNITEVSLDDTFDAVPQPISFLRRVRTENPEERAEQADVTARRGLTAFDAASWHQKGIVVDGEVALITGMNTKAADWDTSDHAVFDPRRMPFDADEDDRLEVAYRNEPSELGPRKDFSVRIEGPAARDVEDYFRSRWSQGISDDVLYADAATPLSALPAAREPSGGVPLQIVATVPEPFLEQTILETHLRAIEQATEYVLIEDQYFRAPIVAEALEQRMWDEPDLVLIVVTNSVSGSDPGLRWTVDNDQRFQRFGDRYVLIQLMATDLYTDVGFLWDTVELLDVPVYNHSKLRIIDDVYVSIGSCNWNNRGYKYEGELNVAILDGPTATATRRRVLAEYVGPYWAPLLSDDMQNNADILALAAEDNADIVSWWQSNGDDLEVNEAIDLWETDTYRTSGWAYPLDFGDDWFWDVGPDAF